MCSSHARNREIPRRPSYSEFKQRVVEREGRGGNGSHAVVLAHPSPQKVIGACAHNSRPAALSILSLDGLEEEKDPPGLVLTARLPERDSRERSLIRLCFEPHEFPF